MSINQSVIFKVILVIVAGFIIFVGINVSFGGIQTLGWQVSPDFVTVADEDAYLIQDSHVRFLGGLFGAMGVFMLISISDLRRFQAELRLIFMVMFFGGLARLTAGHPEVIFGVNVITSFAAEIILMPILFFWLPRIVSDDKNAT